MGGENPEMESGPGVPPEERLASKQWGVGGAGAEVWREQRTHRR